MTLQNYIDTQRCQAEINHLKSVLRLCRQAEARDWSAVQPMRGQKILAAENLKENSKNVILKNQELPNL